MFLIDHCYYVLFIFQKKCEQYWPEEVNGNEEYGDIKVTSVNKQTFNFFGHCLQMWSFVHKYSTQCAEICAY